MTDLSGAPKRPLPLEFDGKPYGNSVGYRLRMAGIPFLFARGWLFTSGARIDEIVCISTKEVERVEVWADENRVHLHARVVRREDERLNEICP